MKKKLLIPTATFSVLVVGAAFYFFSMKADSGLLTWAREKLTGEHQLVPVKGEDGEVDYWTCTMHPSVKMKEPGKCPICAMDLVPVKKAGGATTAGSNIDVDASDRSVFTVDARRQQLLNVNTTPVQERHLEKTIRTVGTLELDETRIERIHTKIKGWISEVFVDFEFQHVKKGDPLFSIYSPELVATQEEYLLALRTAKELSGSPFQNVSSGARSLLESARRRLELFDITAEQIRELEKTGKARKNLIVYSPASGHVIKRNAFPNMHITPETEVYAIADHSRMWLQVQVYENEQGLVRQGQAALMTTAAYPGQVFGGRVTYIYPHVNQQTRTMNVRLEFPNPNLKLKPGMYANIQITIPSRKHLAVPDSAVLRTGQRDLVFVDLGKGRMQLRQVEIGEKFGNFYEILRGLKAGENVVTAANFLIDAESRVQGVEAAWETPKPKSQ